MTRGLGDKAYPLSRAVSLFVVPHTPADTSPPATGIKKNSGYDLFVHCNCLSKEFNPPCQFWVVFIKVKPAATFTGVSNKNYRQVKEKLVKSVCVERKWPRYLFIQLFSEDLKAGSHGASGDLMGREFHNQMAGGKK